MIEAIANVAPYQNIGLILMTIVVVYVIVCEHIESKETDND